MHGGLISVSMSEKNVKLIFFWSLDKVIWDLRNYVRSFVRPSRSFSKTANYFLLKLCSQLGLVSATKIFQALFWKKFRFAHFGEELSKIGHFDPKCPKIGNPNTFIRISYFFALSLVSGVERKWHFHIYGKIQNWPFLAKCGFLKIWNIYCLFFRLIL